MEMLPLDIFRRDFWTEGGCDTSFSDVLPLEEGDESSLKLAQSHRQFPSTTFSRHAKTIAFLSEYRQPLKSASRSLKGAC